MSSQNSMPCNSENQSTLVAGKKRIRSTSVCVWLSPDEQAKIQERMAGLGAPQQAFSQSENCKCYTLALLAVSALPQNCVIVETAYS